MSGSNIDRRRKRSESIDLSTSKRSRYDRSETYDNYERRRAIPRDRNNRGERNNSDFRHGNRTSYRNPSRSFHSSHIVSQVSKESPLSSLERSVSMLKKDLETTQAIVGRLDRDNSATHLIIKNVKLPIIDSSVENSSKLNYEKLHDFIIELLTFILGDAFKSDQLLHLPEMHTSKKYIRINLGSSLIENIMKVYHF